AQFAQSARELDAGIAAIGEIRRQRHREPPVLAVLAGSGIASATHVGRINPVARSPFYVPCTTCRYNATVNKNDSHLSFV
ncbi:hypothetical protein ABTD62_22025, partial [Acinetobacter baumannii]